jgi:hypothetical protein
MALVDALIVPAALGIAASRDARLLDQFGPPLAGGMNDREGIFDGEHVVVVEHGAAGFGLEDHDAVPASRGVISLRMSPMVA